MDLSLSFAVWIDEENGLATFPLWNLSGKLVGYHQYNPHADKTPKTRPKDGRYFTYVTGKKKEAQLAVWGLESFYFRTDILVITEGIFDACQLHRYNIPAIAVLGSSSKPLRNWLLCINRKIYKVNDDHGSSLGQYQNIDIGDNEDMGAAKEEDIQKIVNDILKRRK